MKPLVLVPTYNEVENIGRLLEVVKAEAPACDVLVIDDNSPDGTARVVTAMQSKLTGVYLLNREKKEGLAAAYLAGFRWGLQNGYDVLIEMDADFSHRPSDLPRFLTALETHDVAVGCRYTKGGGTVGWSWIREAISRGGNLYARVLLGLPYQDLTGGFNAWSRKVLETIGIDSIRSKGYAFQVELKFRAHRAGFRITEVPILFSDREFGRSKMNSSIVWEAAYRVFQLRIHH